MNSVYTLTHLHAFDDGGSDFKFIGVFSSRERADSALRNASERPGFREAPEGFRITSLELGPGAADDLAEVWLVFRTHEDEEGFEEVDVLAAAASEADAEALLTGIREQGADQGRLYEWETGPRTLDEEAWPEGYVTMSGDDSEQD